MKEQFDNTSEIKGSFLLNARVAKSAVYDYLVLNDFTSEEIKIADGVLMAILNSAERVS